MDSIWSETVQIGKREHLPCSMERKIVVIGAGMAGLLTAYLLQKQGRDVIVLEASRIAGGQTKNTTAKITGQHGMIYSTLTEKYGKEQARLYAEANERAIEDYGKMIRDEHISCGFERVDSFLYSLEQTEELQREFYAAKAAGIKAIYCENTELPFEVKGAVCFPGQAQFHPLQFVKHVADRLTVYEDTRVLGVNGHWVETKWGSVRADHIVFATHYPFPIAPGFYFARQHQERSYVLAIKGVPKWRGMYYGVDDDSLSFRWYHDILLVGGGSHRTGERKEDTGLRRKAGEIFPGCQEVAFWSAQDCITHDELPFVGRYSLFRPYWYVATGFKKWGDDKRNAFSADNQRQDLREEKPVQPPVFATAVSFAGRGKKRWEDIKISTYNLFHGYFKKKSSRCPHMGCELHWNPLEKTWDCPCHGSRFTEDGELIDNPAQTGLKK